MNISQQQPPAPPTPPCDATGITLTAKASPSTVRRSTATAHNGPLIKYFVMLANGNTNKASTFGPAGLVVALPANTAFVKGRVSPVPTIPGTKRNKTLATPVYDAAANTVTWPDVSLGARRKRKYAVYARVLPAAASPLVFQAACPNCPALAAQASVTVR